MADPVFVDNVTPLNATNMNKLQTRDEKAAANGYASLDSTGKVPLTQLPPVGADLVYNGDYPANSPYTDGDIVVGSDGIAYLCVRDTAAAPTAWPGRPGPEGPPGPQGPAGVGVPTPVVNGQFVKGVGGAAVWAVAPGTEIYYNTLGALGPTGISPNPGDVILNMGTIALEAGANYTTDIMAQGVYSSTQSGGALYFGVYDATAGGYLGGVAVVSLPQTANFGWSGLLRQTHRNVTGGNRALQLRWFAGQAGSYGVSGGGTGVALYVSMRKTS